MPQTQKSVFSSRMFTIFFWGSLGYSILLILNSVIRILAYRETYEFLGEKDQNLSLNSMKISGQCGRLLCCLSYEFDWYSDARRNLPSEGIHLFYDGTNFKITEVNPLTSIVKMLGEDGRLLEVNAKRFTKDSNNRWRIG